MGTAKVSNADVFPNALLLSFYGISGVILEILRGIPYEFSVRPLRPSLKRWLCMYIWNMCTQSHDVTILTGVVWVFFLFSDLVIYIQMCGELPQNVTVCWTCSNYQILLILFEIELKFHLNNYYLLTYGWDGTCFVLLALKRFLD